MSGRLRYYGCFTVHGVYQKTGRCRVSGDAQEWQEHDHTLQPHGPYPGVAENKAHDEEYKGYAKQVDMRYAHQGVQGFAGILGNDGHDVVVTIEIG